MPNRVIKIGLLGSGTVGKGVQDILFQDAQELEKRLGQCHSIYKFLFKCSKKDFIKTIEKLGFQLDHKTGSHFIFYNQEHKKRVTVPYHNKDLPKGTILSILKQAGITKDEIEKNF